MQEAEAKNKEKTQDQNANGEEFIDIDQVQQAWMHTATELWGSMSKIFPDESKLTEVESDARKKFTESMDSAFNIWESLATDVGKPEGLAAFFEENNAIPGNMRKLLKTWMLSYSDIQKQWLESAKNIGELLKNCDIEQPDKDFFKVINGIYINEFSKFFSLPQVGVTREYQERLNKAIDKFNLFFSSFLEFMVFMYLPFKQSFQFMQKNFSDLSAANDLHKDPSGYYKIWLKKLEEHYMLMFHSNEYINVFVTMLDKLGEFKAIKQEILHDMLASNGIPVAKDLDELYKDLYLLKKRVKELEKSCQSCN